MSPTSVGEHNIVDARDGGVGMSPTSVGEHNIVDAREGGDVGDKFVIVPEDGLS